jgi:glutathione S-transferase
MTITLYGSWFSPFARKVALGLELKGLAYEHVDALTREFHAELLQLNPRAEVPELVDAGLIVVNSSDILHYLEQRYPTPPLYPALLADSVAARSLERLADHRFDPIVVDCSFWHWAERADKPPAGLLEAGQADFDHALSTLERALAGRPKPWPFGAPGVVECAWFGNLLSARALRFTFDETRFPHVIAWLRALRKEPLFAADAKRTSEFFKTLGSADTHERKRIFWSGDRIEWLLSRGFHRWLFAEIEAGRAYFPE